jgi:AAHS family benzoate transporter-like MFS transporter
VAEYAPKGKKNLINAITNGGIPLGSLLAALLAALLAIVLMLHIGWRGLFAIGALPIITLLPLAYFKMPESVAWLASRGRLDEARALSERTGVALPDAAPAAAATDDAPTRIGFAGLFSRSYVLPTLVLGLMRATGLMLVYSLNTWLPEIMLRAGFNAKGSLSFLAVLNGGSLFGALAASRAADRFGPKPVVAACFATGAAALVLLTAGFPLAGLLVVVAVVGLGTSGTQTLIYGFVANYYRTHVRAAGVAWCAGFGRLSGIGGPMLGSAMIGAGLQLDAIFHVLAGLGLVGAALTLLVPMARAQQPAAQKHKASPMPAARPLQDAA